MSKTQKDLLCEAYNLLSSKKYNKAEKLLLKALNAKDDNVIDRHFAYNTLIKLYYKLRNERKDALEKCIKYCEEDIKRLPEFLETEEKTNRSQWDYSKERWGHLLGGEREGEYEYHPPQCPSVIQLAIIYEKNGELQKAIDICNFALKLGLKDGTKKGFQGRKAKLEKKLNKD